MSGCGKPDQIQIFCVQLKGIACLGAQSRTQRSIKSRVDPLFVIERIKDENSFGWVRDFLGPSAARNNEGNNEADDSETHWGNSSRAGKPSHGRLAGLACTLTRNATLQCYETRWGSCAEDFNPFPRF